MPSCSSQGFFLPPIKRHAPMLVLVAGMLNLITSAIVSYGDDIDELRVKREENFEFAVEPTLTPRGDKLEIAFTPRAYCDVTIAIEDLDLAQIAAQEKRRDQGVSVKFVFAVFVSAIWVVPFYYLVFRAPAR